ncbi:uncharacterized protein L969DRAFT_89230 [Mixia osmundae IAM 14324]|uniref:Carboxymuconolactone decarboxylase-like domain-containing protein n=1 Tax=Mixia osmundae (strain CBS 9802 / IAM 14324 / JCM 22182 / KY 12970) TaxID=764103 RepID=G7DSG1_MIXOS|nr:uncharacterized protein L969DRAFT_89230 [Mixia osmundae IAM 14324]KEI37984.1 hypothetical protein L969DRAFT_89230 [Mixia osmundae IAM 14324]GAA93521.1 hypothetical protein E5Q_00162 [Mixia osmundae IAM 14324]
MSASKDDPRPARISYRYPSPGSSQVADETRERRQRQGEHGLLPLDGILLHSEPICAGWNALMGQIRRGTTMPPLLIEVLILRVAVLNEATFEWEAHLQDAHKAGITSDQLHKVRQIELKRDDTFEPAYWAALAIADASTRHVKVPQETFDELKSHFDERECVEIMATIASYNMVSRFLVAFNVDGANARSLP